MKVLHIIDSGGFYGAEVMLLNLVAEQIRLGLEPAIASIGDKGIKEKPLETEAIKRGFRLKKFRMHPGPNVVGAFEVLRYAHRENFDLVHSHGYKGNILVGFMPKFIRNLPLVVTLHGWTSTNGISKMRLYEWLDRRSLWFVDAVVLVNKGMRYNPRLPRLNKRKLYVVNNGIPLDDSPARSHLETLERSGECDKTIIEFCQRGFTIGSIGRLSAEKGFGLLLHAIKKAAQNCPELRLLIIGEGAERKKLENLIRALELSDKVLLPGFLPQAKDHLALIHALVLPSLTEGLPMVALEAMHAGVPIVATRVGGLPEVLEDGKAGVLVNKGCPDSLAQGILTVVNDLPLRDKLVARARQRVEEEYSSRQMAKGYLEIYQELASAR